MKYFIIFCTPICDRLISNDIISQHDMFKNSKYIFEEHNIKIKYYYEFLNENDSYKYFDKKINYSINDDLLLNQYKNDCVFILDEIIKNEIYNNSIILGFESLGFDIFLNNNYYQQLKDKNITFILSIYDPHTFYNNILIKKLNITRIDLKKKMFDYYEKYQNIYKLFDKRLEMTDMIISPSIDYFKNINSDYYNKCHFIPFSINFNNTIIFNIQKFDNFNNRENKIILSGALEFYRIRKLLLNIYNEENIDFVKNNVINYENINLFKTLIFYYKYTKYYRKNLDDEEGGIKYCKTLSLYKGSFICFGDFPIDFPLAKLFESLIAGCICFIEFKPFLKEYLGLIEYFHYIPILLSNEKKLILNYEYYENYLNSDEGIKIAKQGYKFAIDNFADNNVSMQYINILKNKNVI